jgi:hypothetical protein
VISRMRRCGEAQGRLKSGSEVKHIRLGRRHQHEWDHKKCEPDQAYSTTATLATTNQIDHLGLAHPSTHHVVFVRSPPRQYVATVLHFFEGPLTQRKSVATRPTLASTLHATSTSPPPPPKSSKQQVAAPNPPSTTSTTPTRPVD